MDLQTVPSEILYSAKPELDTGIRVVDNQINPMIASSLAPNIAESVNPIQIVVFIVSYLWAAGMIILFGYALFSYLRIRRCIQVSSKVEQTHNIYICDNIPSPFILGILCPDIYIPSGVDPDTLDYVLAHEKAHLTRRDHLWKPLGYALLVVYWFHPLMWAAYVLLCKDIELACDEKVIKGKNLPYRKAYSEALLSLSISRRMITACPLAFGEVGVKDRIKSVMHYKRPAFRIMLLSVFVCMVVGICFLTNPKAEVKMPQNAEFFTLLDTNEYTALSRESNGRIYVPFMPLTPELMGDCIGYYVDGGEIVYVCRVKGQSDEEWLCDTLDLAACNEGMVLREEHVTDFPNWHRFGTAGSIFRYCFHLFQDAKRASRFHGKPYKL